jgi:hypothetical protein
VDEQNNKTIELDGVLNTKPGHIRIDRSHIGFLFELDAKKQRITFTDRFHYTHPGTGEVSPEWAIAVVATRFENYLELCDAEGLSLSENSMKGIISAFDKALADGAGKANVTDWLYDHMPDFVLLQRNKQLLTDDLATLLTTYVDEGGLDGINEERVVLRILAAFITENQEDQNFILEQLCTRYIGKKTLFEVLYDRMNDFGGADNWTAAIQLLYKLWIASKFSDPDIYPYNGQPETLAYQSKKILGFYKSGYTFAFDDREIAVGKFDSDKLIITKEAAYEILQPIQLQEVDEDGKLILQKGELEMPEKIPAFYLKAFDDKNKWEDFEKAVWLAADIVLTFTAVGNLLKLRYLKYLPKGIRYIRFATGSLQLVASIVDTMLNFVNDCKTGSFCKQLRHYLFWVSIATISVDLITERMLRKAARKALDEADDTIPESIRQHLEEVAMESGVHRSRNAKQLAKSLDDAPKKVLEFEAKHIDAEFEIGLIYNNGQKVNLVIQSGRVDTIILDAKTIKLLDGSYVTHIHPTGSSFSIADFKLFFTTGLKELRAVSPDGVVYCLKSRKVNFLMEDFNDLIEQVKEKIKTEFAIGKGITDAHTIKRLETMELEKQLEGFMDYIQYK